MLFNNGDGTYTESHECFSEDIARWITEEFPDADPNDPVIYIECGDAIPGDQACPQSEAN